MAAAATKKVTLVLEKEKDTKRFTKFSLTNENGDAEITGALYVRKGTGPLADAASLKLTVEGK